MGKEEVTDLILSTAGLKTELAKLAILVSKSDSNSIQELFVQCTTGLEAIILDLNEEFSI